MHVENVFTATYFEATSISTVLYSGTQSSFTSSKPRIISSNKSLWWQSQTVFRDYIGHFFLPFDVVQSLRNWTLPFPSLKYIIWTDDSFAYGSWSLRNLNRVEGFSHTVLGIIIWSTTEGEMEEKHIKSIHMQGNPSCSDIFFWVSWDI